MLICTISKWDKTNHLLRNWPDPKNPLQFNPLPATTAKDADNIHALGRDIIGIPEADIVDLREDQVCENKSDDPDKYVPAYLAQLKAWAKEAK